MSDFLYHRFYLSRGGSHRGALKGGKVSVRKFYEKLSEPTVDASITYAQYRKLDDNDRNERKAAPGHFIGAEFEGGKRKASHFVGKWLIQIDIDNATQEQINYILDGHAELNRWGYVWHTTRSHCPEKPKVRIILFANRAMTADEANAITRYLCCLLADDPEDSIEIPDTVSHKVNQIMYWPSISKGQEFKHGLHEGELVDPDNFLAERPEWTDYTALPRPHREKDVRGRAAKAEDPTEKQGVIGAFCQAYTVQDAIERFLEDVYAPGDSSTEERYSYLKSSSGQVNGAVVYDDGLFLHSHHSSDPAEGLHNAFDLVRIHKFGHKDDAAHGNTSPGNMPSFKAMSDWARRLPEVAGELFGGVDDDFEDYEDESWGAGASEAVRPGKTPPHRDDTSADDLLDTSPEDDLLDTSPPSLDDEFDDYDDDPEPAPKTKREKPDMAWTAGLRTKKNGDVEPVAHNIKLICQNDAGIAPCIAYNEFTMDPVMVKHMRFKKLKILTGAVTDRAKGWRIWQDGDDIAIQMKCSAPAPGGYGVDFGRDKIEAGVLMAGMLNSFHPVRDEFERCHRLYVESGRKTKGLIEQIPQKYLGCPDDAFHRESSRMLMLGMAGRTKYPGIKFDAVAILRGEQGGRKGSFWRTLARSYFANLPNSFDAPQKMVESMRGALIGELGEMAGLRGETTEVAKDFITRQEDQLRLAYGRREGIYPRKGILTGTSNLTDILHDPTGNRRFWIWVDSHSEKNPIDIAGLKADLDMLWGEAWDELLREVKERGVDDLYLDLRTNEAREQRDALAGEYRAKGAIEEMAEIIEEHLDTLRDSGEVALEDQEAGAEEFEDEAKIVRNMVPTGEVLKDLRSDPSFAAYRNADRRTIGKALALVPGWTCLGKQRRHGQAPTVWYARGTDVPKDYKGPKWVLAADVIPPDDEPSDADLLS